MAFSGPESADFDNVSSLNTAWLGLLQRECRLRHGLAGLPEMHRRRITSLRQSQIRRLAATPFLLFSFRETDDRYWSRILGDHSHGDLFAVSHTNEADTVISAALGFIWQLARRNPYALRLICGATVYWTERIADQTFYGLLNAVRVSGDIPPVRFAEKPELWRKLLDSGVSGEALNRHAAQLSALQAVLTVPPGHRVEAWPLAARRMKMPQLCVADRNESGGD